MRGDEIIRVPAPGIMQIITTGDRESYIGRITEIKEGKVRFNRIEDEGDTLFTLENVLKIKEIPASDIRKGKYWFPNPNASRLCIAQTGRPIPKSHGSIADFELILPLFSYAVTDNISVAGGGTFINNIGNNRYFTAFYLFPKIGFNVEERFALAGGAGWVHAFGVEEDFANVGFVYGAATLGEADASLTFGIGYGFSQNRYWGSRGYEHNYLWPKAPGMMLGGEFRFIRRVSVVSENYLIHDGEVYAPVVGIGVRTFGEKYSVDVVMFNTFGYGGLPAFPGLPFIGVVYNF